MSNIHSQVLINLPCIWKYVAESRSDYCKCFLSPRVSPIRGLKQYYSCWVWKEPINLIWKISPTVYAYNCWPHLSQPGTDLLGLINNIFIHDTQGTFIPNLNEIANVICIWLLTTRNSAWGQPIWIKNNRPLHLHVRNLCVKFEGNRSSHF